MTETASPGERDWAARIVEAEHTQGAAAAMPLAEQAIAAFPNSAELWNLAGNVRLHAGDADGAAAWFAQAMAREPRRLDFALNTAIAWSSARRYDAALGVLDPFEEQGRRSAVYCSTRATAERGAGRIHAAATWYDRALTLEPARKKALHGRARTALEAGEADAVGRFDRALAVDPGNAELWLGKAQALDAAGDRDGALAIAEQLADKVPTLIDNLRFCAQLRRDMGRADYAECFAAAARAAPADPTIPGAHVAWLAGLDRYAEAAEVAAAARARFDDEHFALLEAINRDAAGQHGPAGEILATLSLARGDLLVHAARHALRSGEPDRAIGYLDRLLESDPWDQQAWSLRMVLWRLCDDPRLPWLLGDGRLVRSVELARFGALAPSLAPLLDRLHDTSPFPLGQSLRGGTQTRGNLFDRRESALAALADAIRDTLETYRAGLPPADPTHPFLRYRDLPWRIGGSWSVRLQGGGDHHASHVHPQGVLSSALYLRVPAFAGAAGTRPGWLEIGRPPANLNVDLEPVSMIEPVEGAVALFPSYLFHGTRPFRDGDRLTVAFDVVVKDAGD